MSVWRIWSTKEQQSNKLEQEWTNEHGLSEPKKIINSAKKFWKLM